MPLLSLALEAGAIKYISKYTGWEKEGHFYFLHRAKMYYKKQKISICLFDKSCGEDIVKFHILHKESEVDES